MAFLLPENIPSRSGVPDRLRQVARALRDFAPSQVTVWLRNTDSGLPYLVVLDPASGIAVIEAPSLSTRGHAHRRRGRVFDSFDMITVAADVAAAANGLRHSASKEAIARMPVKCVLAVPDLDEVPLERLVQADRELPILTRTDLNEGRLEDALARLFGSEQLRPLNEREQKRARAVVNPEIILRTSGAERLPLFQDPEIAPEDAFRVMDREQERVAEHLRAGYRVLRGVAGSGKTLVLAHRARHVHKHWPNWRVLVLCYNRVLAEALKTMMSPDDRLVVTNVDRLARRLAGTKSRRGPPDFEARVLEAARKAERSPDSERFDVVLVDEAQDLDFPRLNLAYSMLKSDRLKPDATQPDRDNFVMAYDVAQNVYSRGGARWNPPGVDAQGRPRTARGRTTVFRKNYRNTREILEFAMHFLSGSSGWSSASVDLDDPAALIPPEAANRSGPKPSLKSCRDLRGEAEGIASRVWEKLHGGVAVHDIAVLYGTEALEVELQAVFASRGLPYFHVQQRDGRGWMTNRDKAVEVHDKVRVSTLTGIKGLEFSRVIIGGVNQVQVRDVAEGDQFGAAKSQLYAAMTRAMDELEITMSGDGEIGAALREAERLQRVG